MKGKHLVVISFDAMVSEDLDLLSSMPCFGNFLKEGSRVSRIRSCYPSLTYPAHTTILTGTGTGKHGIVNNEPFEPGNLKCSWYWFHDPVKVKDIHQVAKEKGLVTASVFWPVTGAHPYVDHLMAEYWAQGPQDTFEEAHFRAGTSEKDYKEIIEPLKGILDCHDSIITDEGKTLVACEFIKRYKPNLITIHLGQIDSMRHKNGIFNGIVEKAAIKSEEYLSMIMEACKEAGIYEETNFIVLSDHGQINYSRKMNLNKIFVDGGFATVNNDGSLSSWKAFGKSANFSAHIYVSDPSLEGEVYKYLCFLRDKGSYGIGTVLTKEESKLKYGLYGDFSFVLESDGTTLFTNDWKGELFIPANGLKASHGHDPDIGPQPVFAAFGPDIKKGVILSKGNLIDEAPTMALLLELSLPEAEGKAFDSILY
ncbi:MAG: alkaline phosphatase family protein [Sphaerochaetaceae bacterium]|nr:alkaline phosphatase family protein [Sphaerochaetaceae bacterium]